MSQGHSLLLTCALHSTGAGAGSSRGPRECGREEDRAVVQYCGGRPGVCPSVSLRGWALQGRGCCGGEDVNVKRALVHV